MTPTDRNVTTHPERSAAAALRSYLPKCADAGPTLSRRLAIAVLCTCAFASFPTAAWAQNHEPTGKPSIGGIATVPNVLTADIGSIEDGDGVPAKDWLTRRDANRSNTNWYRYQWLRGSASPHNCHRLFGQDENTYRLAPPDAGQTIRVAVCFLDLNGTWETVVSDPFPISGNVQTDTSPPVLQAGPATYVRELGWIINLKFNEILNPGAAPDRAVDEDVPPRRCDPSWLPPANAFSVTVAGKLTHQIRRVAVERCQTWNGVRSYIYHLQGHVQVLLGVDELIKKGQTVMVSYTDPTSGDDRGALQDRTGNDVASFEVEVPNRSEVPLTDTDVTDEPRLTSALVYSSGGLASVTFDEELKSLSFQGERAVGSAFTLKANNTPITVGVATSYGTEFDLSSLSQFITQGQTVTVSYTKPTSGTVLQDTDGNDVQSFTDFPVTNYSSLTAVPAPVPVDAVVGSDGETVDINFENQLHTSSTFGFDSFKSPHPFFTAFIATIDGVSRAPQSIDVSTQGENKVALGFKDNPIGRGQVVTVSYAKPTTGVPTDVLRSVTGAQTASFTDLNVTNNALQFVGPALRVADVTVTEGTDATADFAVTLDPAGTETVTVDYATSEGTATAGDDYTSTSGTLTFSVGETSKTIQVPIVDDSVEDSGETFTLTLSNPSGGGNAHLRRPQATGTILNTDPPASEPLTASFENVPASHDGASAFTFELRFSEAFPISYLTMRDHAFTVTNGDVTGARRLDNPHHEADGMKANRRWEITVEPDSREAVAITLPGGRGCGTTGAVCTSGDDPRPLSNSPSATVAGPQEDPVVPQEDPVVTNTAATGAPTISGTARADEPLTASVSGISDDDGLDNASFGYQWIRGSTDIQGATDSSYALVSADEGERIKVRVSFTDGAGNAESLTSAATDTVAAAPEPLTASFSGVPTEHTGEKFTFGLTFSEDLELSYRTLRDQALAASGGTVRRAKRQQSGSNRRWTIHVEPASHGPVTIQLPAGSVETVDGRALSNSPSATVAGPVGISVADARVDEGEGAQLAFSVTLSRPATSAVTVDYATADGSARAGVDYTAASGTLSFQAGDSSKTIEVTVLDDSHDEGEETLTLTLSNASNGQVADGEATGTIKNHDPLPRALVARFGRTAAVHVVEHVEERMQAPREPGFRGRFAGQELRRGMERDVALSFLSQLGGSAGVQAPGGGIHGPMAGSPVAGAASLGTPGLGGNGLGGSALGMAAVGGPMGSMSGPAGPMGAASGPLGGGLLSMGLGGGDVLTGSAFALNRETRQGGILSFWSRGAQSSFYGNEGALALNGDVRTTMFGADYAKGPVVMGLSLSNSRGLGEYAGANAGQVASSVTGLYPWLGYQATDRVSVWGVAGYGAGGMLLTPAGGPALESGLSMAMAAAGTRGELVAGGASGFELAFKADALWVGTSVDGVDGAAGRLAATEAAVTRFRAGLEGSRDYTFAGRLSLRPSVEVGLRHDGGDAETGAGMDVGGGLVVADAGTGLAVDVRVRMLLVHQAEGFRERGMAVSLSYNPTPSTPLGLVARVAPSWGGQATSGAEALWGQETMAGMGHGSVTSGTRLDAEVGYGLPVGSRFVGTPRVGVGTSASGKDYRLGYGLGVLNQERLHVELGVDAHHRESPMRGGTDNGFLGRATLGW